MGIQGQDVFSVDKNLISPLSLANERQLVQAKVVRSSIDESTVGPCRAHCRLISSVSLTNIYQEYIVKNGTADVNGFISGMPPPRRLGQLITLFLGVLV